MKVNLRLAEPNPLIPDTLENLKGEDLMAAVHEIIVAAHVMDCALGVSQTQTDARRQTVQS